ncbi:hypothetical protein [Metabacillus indicus]|uniref:hypothetical protein n=1 Tax=Metabacillus indicus TaxID=246786 RepID=UPI003CF34DB5
MSVKIKVKVKDINIVTATGRSFAANKVKAENGGQLSGNQGRNANQGGQIAGANGKNANQLSAIVDIGAEDDLEAPAAPAEDTAAVEPGEAAAAEPASAPATETAPINRNIWNRLFKNY